MPCKPVAWVVFPVNNDDTGWVGGCGCPFPASLPQKYLGCGQMMAHAWLGRPGLVRGCGGPAAVGTGAPAFPSLSCALPRICSLLPRADITPLSLLAPNVCSIRKVLATGPCPAHTGFCWTFYHAWMCTVQRPSPRVPWGTAIPSDDIIPTLSCASTSMRCPHSQDGAETNS